MRFFEEEPVPNSIETHRIYISRSPACWWAEPHLRQALSLPSVFCNHVLSAILEYPCFSEIPITDFPAVKAEPFN